MPRCNCRKKMRLRSDGWKRCYRCGKEVMGLALRAELGRRSMMEEFPQHYAMDASASLAQSPTEKPKIRAVWRSNAALASARGGE